MIKKFWETGTNPDRNKRFHSVRELLEAMKAITDDKAQESEKIMHMRNQMFEVYKRYGGEINMNAKKLDSVYLRSSQNSQPNSDTPDMNSRKERGSVFCIARSDASPAF